MTPSPRFDIQDDMQLDFVLYVLDGLDCDLAVYQYRLTHDFGSDAEEAYRAFDAVRNFLHEFQRDALGVVDGSEGN